jgi:hypothetical protein
MTHQADAPEDTIEDMLAKHCIREVLARYARAIDRADGALLKSCYHPDAIEEHGGTFSGNAWAYVEQAIPKVMLMGPMQHLLGNSFIELAGDTAHVETYLWTFARFTGGDRDWDTFTGGRLLDRFERREAGWRIAHRRTIFDWNRDVVSAQGWCLGRFTPAAPGMLLGRKGREDPSYECL